MKKNFINISFLNHWIQLFKITKTFIYKGIEHIKGTIVKIMENELMVIIEENIFFLFLE